MKVEITITPEMLQLIAGIEEFRGRWEALGAISRDVLTELKKTATIESVGSSTRIEGSRMTDRQVETLLANIKIQKFTTRDEQEVAGYGEVMNMIFDSWDLLDLNENHLLQLHNILLSYSTKDERHRGSYKTLDNHVAAFDADGSQLGIVFETSSPFETPAHMQELLEWMKLTTAENKLHALIRVAVFNVWFLAVHPFQDGNGRISRALTTLLLLQSGYEHVPYASIERVIEDNKEGYYRALRATQASFKGEEIDWNTWIIFFLRTLKKQCEVLRQRVEQHRVMQASRLTALGSAILQLFSNHEYLTNREIVALTDSNKNTVKYTLTQLVNEKLIAVEGKGRSTRYRLI